MENSEENETVMFDSLRFTAEPTSYALKTTRKIKRGEPIFRLDIEHYMGWKTV